MEIRIDKNSPIPIYLQISGGIKDLILGGKLPEGFRLPPERTLARALGVNRTTILNAYRELKADSLVDAHVGRGTTVLPRRFTEKASTEIAPPPWGQLVREGGAQAQDPLLRNLLELTERPDTISLAVGLPAPELLPLDALSKVESALYAEIGPTVLLHSPTEGVTSFRQALAEFSATRGIQCSPAEILVTSGSQQVLDLAARVFIEPGDAVIVEEPSYIGALLTFRRAQARLIGVPTDQDGMRVDILEEVLARRRPKFIYTLPTYQNPSGAVMTLERRRRLLELAYRHQAPILEDDPYSELHYEGEAPPSLAALDQHGYVMHLSSFSKVLFPGLRVGYLIAPRPVIRQLALAKQSVDLHSNTPGQFILERFLRDGHLARHLRAVRAEYAERRDTMEAALRREAPAGVSWNRPSGGFYFWLRLPDSIPSARLLALASERRVAFLPGAACFPSEPVEHRLRLNFTFAPVDQINEGVARLMDAVRAAAQEPHDRAREVATPPIV